MNKLLYAAVVLASGLASQTFAHANTADKLVRSTLPISAVLGAASSPVMGGSGYVRTAYEPTQKVVVGKLLAEDAALATGAGNYSRAAVDSADSLEGNSLPDNGVSMLAGLALICCIALRRMR